MNPNESFNSSVVGPSWTTVLEVSPNPLYPTSLLLCGIINNGPAEIQDIKIQIQPINDFRSPVFDYIGSQDLSGISITGGVVRSGNVFAATNGLPSIAVGGQAFASLRHLGASVVRVQLMTSSGEAVVNVVARC